jgi:hypothetical protein
MKVGYFFILAAVFLSFVLDATTSSTEHLKNKLNELESSLRLQRVEMEDNPGDVTNEMEEKYKSLQLEVLYLFFQLPFSYFPLCVFLVFD